MELVGAESVCSLSHRSVPLGTEAFTVRLQIFLRPYGRVLGCVGRVYGSLVSLVLMMERGITLHS